MKRWFTLLLFAWSASSAQAETKNGTPWYRTLSPDVIRPEHAAQLRKVADGMATVSRVSLEGMQSPEVRLDKYRQLRNFYLVPPPGQSQVEIGFLHRFRYLRKNFGVNGGSLIKDLEAEAIRQLGFAVRVTSVEVGIGRGTENETPHRDGASRDFTMVIPLGDATGTRYFIDGKEETSPSGTLHGREVLHAHGRGPRIRVWLSRIEPSSKVARRKVVRARPR